MKAFILLSLVSVHTLAAVCSTTDGSEANTVPCTCGSATCTSTTGLICYSTYGGGSCRKTGLGAFGYTKGLEYRNCGSVSNRKPILDKTACEAAATSMELDDVVASEVSWLDEPPGCYSRSGSLKYNTKFTSTGSCDSSWSDFCLCIAASDDCTHTGGATSNTNVCLCGGTACTAASGLYCASSSSTCSSGNTCTSVGGSSLNTIDCQCGTAVCNSFNGMYCYVSNSQCSLVGECTHTNGTTSNTDTCFCGSATCTADNGLYCDAHQSKCGFDCASRNVGVHTCFVTRSVMDCSGALDMCVNNTAAVKTWYNDNNNC